MDYLNMLDRIYVFDGFAGWDPEVRQNEAPVRRHVWSSKPLFEVQRILQPN